MILLLFMFGLTFYSFKSIFVYISILGLIIQFFVTKFMTLRIHKRPHIMGNMIYAQFTHLMPFCFWICLLSSLYFYLRVLKKSIFYECLTVTVLMFIFIFILRQLLNSKFKKKPISEKKWENRKFRFHYDYQRENPVTRDQAFQDYLNEMSSSDFE